VAIRLNGTIRRASHQSPGKVFALEAAIPSTPSSVCGEADRSVVMRSPCAGAALDLPLDRNPNTAPLEGGGTQPVPKGVRSENTERHQIFLEGPFICTRGEKRIHRAEDLFYQEHRNPHHVVFSSVEPLLERVMCPPLPSPLRVSQSRGPAHKGARRAGGSNNWTWLGAGWSLRLRGSQTKLSHVGAVAFSGRQREFSGRQRERGKVFSYST
jgi:hypothetical protein